MTAKAHQDRSLSPQASAPFWRGSLQGSMRVVFLVTLLAGSMLTAGVVMAQDNLIYQFKGLPSRDGAYPNAELIADSHGNLYGTTEFGGSTGTGGTACSVVGCGTIFEICAPTTVANGICTPSAAYVEHILYSFQGCSGCGSSGDGATPAGGLIFDSVGNLYGTTGNGGNQGCGSISGCGTVFVYCLSATGPWCASLSLGEHVLARMLTPATDLRHPVDKLLIDSNFNLYGTTFDGGLASDCGAGYPNCGGVFLVCAPSSPSPLPCKGNPISTYNEIYFFTGAGNNDGGNPIGGLVMDSAGILYGTTASGGTGVGSVSEPCQRFPESVLVSGCGTIFKLSLSGSTWTDTVLYSFAGYPNDGSYPLGTLVWDAAKKNLYGTTEFGPQGGGTVFEYSFSGSPTILFEFANRWDGGNAYAGVSFDPTGKYLFGTTYSGGGGSLGTAYELQDVSGTWVNRSNYPLTGQALWSFEPYNLVHGQCLPSFNGTDGCSPFGGAIYQTETIKKKVTKLIFGTTYQGGTHGFGTVYDVTFLP
jgi:hypothetical protein